MSTEGGTSETVRLDFMSKYLKDMFPIPLALLILSFLPHRSITDFVLPFPEEKNRFIKFFIVYRVKETWRTTTQVALSSSILVELKSEMSLTQYLPWKFWRLSVGGMGRDLVFYEGYVVDPKIRILENAPLNYKEKCFNWSCHRFPMKLTKFCSTCLPKETWRSEILEKGFQAQVDKARINSTEKNIRNLLTVTWIHNTSKDVMQCVLSLQKVCFYYENLE